jgi:hypothetical protein
MNSFPKPPPQPLPQNRGRGDEKKGGWEPFSTILFYYRKIVRKLKFNLSIIPPLINQSSIDYN